jgi:chromosome segregation ATPase
VSKVINTSINKEQTSTRITEETNERIENIKKHLETEKIEQTTITEQTSTYEHIVDNVNKQIEEISNTLEQEIKHESETSIDASETTDTTSIKHQEELTTELNEKRTNITNKITNANTKIETLTNKVTTLEENISRVSKEIVTIKVEIEHITTTTNSLIKEREEKRQESKIVSTSESTHILDEIARLNKMINDYKN